MRRRRLPFGPCERYSSRTQRAGGKMAAPLELTRYVYPISSAHRVVRVREPDTTVAARKRPTSRGSAGTSSSTASGTRQRWAVLRSRAS
jgi:hypothetical protein